MTPASRFAAAGSPGLRVPPTGYRCRPIHVRPPHSLSPAPADPRRSLPFTVALLVLALGSGCTPLPVAEQGRLTKPNMVMAETASFGYANRLQSQIEPGAATTGGAQAAGCTSCK